MIGDETRTKKFPTSIDEMNGEDAKFLFEISTEIPNSYKLLAKPNSGMAISDGGQRSCV